MLEFFYMGGYAAFVWPGYGLTAIILWLNWYLPRKQHEKYLGQLRRRNRAIQPRNQLVQGASHCPLS